MNWNNEKQAVLFKGCYLLTHPESGTRWQSKEEAQRWYDEETLKAQQAQEEEAQALAEQLAKVTPVQINTITGAERVPSQLQAQKEIKVTVAELTDLKIEGALALVDQTFVMPVQRDDGRRVYFPVTLQDGKFTAILNFPTSGRFTVTEALLNEEGIAPTLNIAPMVFYVIRKAAA